MTLRSYLRLLPVLLAVVALSGCELAEGIFKAGMAVGELFVVLFVALVFPREQGETRVDAR